MTDKSKKKEQAKAGRYSSVNCDEPTIYYDCNEKFSGDSETVDFMADPTVYFDCNEEPPNCSKYVGSMETTRKDKHVGIENAAISGYSGNFDEEPTVYFDCVEEFPNGLEQTGILKGVTPGQHKPTYVKIFSKGSDVICAKRFLARGRK